MDDTQLPGAQPTNQANNQTPADPAVPTTDNSVVEPNETNSQDQLVENSVADTVPAVEVPEAPVVPDLSEVPPAAPEIPENPNMAASTPGDNVASDAQVTPDVPPQNDESSDGIPPADPNTNGGAL